MTASAGAWYRVGTVNVTNGQQSIVGVNTNWQNDVISIAVGDIFTLDARTWYEVTAVNSDTSLTLDREFEGATQSAVNYAIVRNTSGTLLTRIAGQIAVQFNQKQLFLDELRTWLNSDNAAEELTDSHGVKTQLKTPAQMVRDHDEKLAELDSIHPHPWAMRKVEFEAMRAANNEKYAANGFVHLGIGHSSGNVNSGLWTATSLGPNIFALGKSGVASGQIGDSKTDYPVVNIAGVITDINSVGYASSKNLSLVKLPPAEDGTRTYDSATGVPVIHATPALAFAAETATNEVVTDRVDMWGFEAYLREITDSDPFVYKNGLIQSLASDINGVVTVSDNVRPVTYFAWYEGDTTSRGKGVNWQTATEAQRIAIASEPENNIYFDDATGKFYQWCIRGRSFAGAGNGDWENVDSYENEVASMLRFSTFSRVNAQGTGDLTPTLTGYNTDNYLSYKNSLVSSDNVVGLFKENPNGTPRAINGECYFLVCDTVERLNRGAYHPSFNSLGTAKLRLDTGVGGAKLWHESGAKSPSNKADCFSFGDDLTVGDVAPFVGNSWGSLVAGITLVGRPDGRYYDAIYASGEGGVCRDMRYSAWGLTAEDFAEQDLKIKSGEYRGREVLLKTEFIPETVTVGGVATYTAANAGGTIAFATSDSDNPRDQDSNEFSDLGATHWLLAGDNGETMVIKRVSLSGTSVKWPYSNNAAYLYGSGDVDSEFNSKFPVGTKLWLGAMYPVGVSAAGEFTHTEVMGDPAHISLCDDFKDGWVGSWNPTIPDGTSQTYILTRPSENTTTLQNQIVTEDQGNTWSTGAAAYDIASSSITGSYSASRVAVWQYKTKAKMTTQSNVSEIHGAISDVNYLFTSMDASNAKGRLLNYSLTGLIQTHAATATKIGLETFRLESLPLLPALGKFLGFNASAGELRHSPLSLDAPSNDSPAFKALNYNVAKNQQGFINYAYAQLTYDATAGDWGDDGKIHIADNQTKMLDENGHTNLVGTAQSVEPIGWV